MKHLFFAMILMVSNVAFSATNVGSDLESYLDRKSILEVQPLELKNNPNWEKLRKAQFDFAAQLLGMYPENTEIYLLARDSEYLYDVLKLVTHGTPQEKRIHLLNVSRANMKSVNLKRYLEDNGISEKELLSGKRVLFVDTGFAGTIPYTIGQHFTSEARKQMFTQLIVSSNSAHPSSRLFLLHLNGNINELDPQTMHGTIVTYEHLPRETERSHEYVKVAGRYHPVSTRKPIQSDGSVSKANALKFRQDLRAAWELPKTKEQFKKTLNMVIQVRNFMNAGNVEKLKALQDQQKDFDARRFQSIVLDTYELATKSKANLKFNLADIGIKSAVSNSLPTTNKLHLIAANPEWAQYLENPDDGIPLLFEKKDWATLGAIMDAGPDAEIQGLIASNLFEKPATGVLRNMQILFIEKFASEDQQLFYDLLMGPLGPNEYETFRYLFPTIVKQGLYFSPILNLLTEYLKYPGGFKRTELIDGLLAINSLTVNSGLIDAVTDSEDGAKQENLILRILNSSSALTHADYLKIVDSDYLANWDQVLEKLIRMGDESIRMRLITHHFFEEASRRQFDYFRMLFEDNFSQAEISQLKASAVLMGHAPFSESRLKALRESLDITGRNKKISFLDSKLGPKKSKPQTEFVEAPKEKVKTKSEAAVEISPDLKSGDIVKIQNKKYTVIGDAAGEGVRGVVFKVQNQAGTSYALKVAKDSTPETLRSFSRESKKAEALKKIGLKHAQILVHEPTYILKEWIDGTSGEEVVQEFLKGNKKSKTAAAAVLDIVYKLRSEGAYVGDFRPANLIWNGKDWIVIDSGSVKSGLTLEVAAAKWQQAEPDGQIKFERRWSLKLKPVKCEKLLQ